MAPVEIGIAGIITVFLLLFLKMPVAYVMIVVGMSGFALRLNTTAALSVATSSIYTTFTDYSLIVIPLFIWMGYIAYYAGISSRIYDASYKLMGSLPAGLAHATIAACTAFGAISGSTTATAATMGAIALPEMEKYKYDNAFSAATVSAAATLGIKIPPSVILILYGIATGESIRRLFLATIIPGLLLTALFMLTVGIWAYLQPSIAPLGPRVSWKEKLQALVTGGLEVVIIFLIVIGGLFAGIFTPTEAGAVGAFSTLLVAILGRRLSWQDFLHSLRDTLRVSAMVMFLVTGAMIFGRFLGITGIPRLMAQWAVSLPLPPLGIFAVIMLIYLVLGFFIDALALLLLTVPIFYPAVIQLGFHPIWFGIIMVLVVGMGVITPPVGANVYVVAGVAKDTPVMSIFRKTWPFLMAKILLMITITLFPEIVMILPSLAR